MLHARANPESERRRTGLNRSAKRGAARESKESTRLGEPNRKEPQRRLSGGT